MYILLIIIELHCIILTQCRKSIIIINNIVKYGGVLYVEARFKIRIK